MSNENARKWPAAKMSAKREKGLLVTPRTIALVCRARRRRSHASAQTLGKNSSAAARIAAQSLDSQRSGKNRGAEPGLAAQSLDSQNMDFDAVFAALRAGMFRRRLALRCQPTCNSSFIRNPPLQPAQLFVSNSRPQSMGVYRPPRSRCRSSSTLRSRLQENQASHTRGSLMSTIAAARHFRQASG